VRASGNVGRAFYRSLSFRPGLGTFPPLPDEHVASQPMAMFFDFRRTLLHREGLGDEDRLRGLPERRHEGGGMKLPAHKCELYLKHNACLEALAKFRREKK